MPVRRTLAGELVGMMIVDPGGTTGLGWGDFKLQGESSYDIVREGLTRSIEFRYSEEIDMAEHLAQQWLELVFHWTVECLIPKEHQFLVCEDFILDAPGSKRFTQDRNMLSPIRIEHMMKGMLFMHEPNYMMQMPSLGAQITNDRLRRHGLWVPQKDRVGDHQLSVRRHAVTAVRSLLS